MKPVIWAVIMLVFWSLGCKPQQKVRAPNDAPSVEIVEERLLDTLFVSAPPISKPDQQTDTTGPSYTLPVYQASHTRRQDLLHTRLDLRFDWEQELVLGEATLTLSPYFYPVSTVTLDAKGFEFHRVSFAGHDQPLPYEYDQQQITIDLGREYLKDETYQLVLEYTAAPQASGGSAAITSDQGLFFINPRGEDPAKPRQIWTQGETEWNSRWFPTIDKPNERTTQEVLLTVEDRFQTLSNGVLVSSQDNPDGTRTDHWQLDLPHAPYLFMLAVGEFAVVRDQWNDIPVEYYVEEPYREDARAIFSHTPEMLSFFSEALGMPYPWPKYAQIVVRDYVSGAMENTTSVVFGEFVQRHRRDLIDNHNEGIIAHEMIHHWFGDLVTCESWANLAMNEGFATYGEYLWFEHKYGRDEADYQLIGEWDGYLGSARNNIHPLIYFGYNNRESMFDAHSYNKGGAILHMLRHYVGDDAFRTGLQTYLEDNAYQAVEAHDLRLAFEKVTGEDLNWFFNQWFFSQGHPVLDIEYGYDPDLGQATVTVKQTQDPSAMPPVFILPVAIDLYLAEGKPPVRHQIRMNQREQTFSFPAPQAPKLVIFDAERMLLAERQENKTEEQLVFQFFHAPRLLDRYEAVLRLRDSDHPGSPEVIRAALADPFWVIRAIGIEGLGAEPSEEDRSRLRNLALQDPNAKVRSIAIDKLAEIADDHPATLEAATRIIRQDSAYSVQASALYLLYTLDAENITAYAEQLMHEPSDPVLDVVEIILEESGDPQYLPFFEKRLLQVDGFGAVSLIGSYQRLAMAAPQNTRMEVMDKLEAIARSPGQSAWRKLAATKALSDTRRQLENLLEGASADSRVHLQADIERLTAMVRQIKEQETDPDLLNFYEQF